MKNVNTLFLFILFLAFTINAQVPDSPVLTEPPDVDIIVPTTITLEWLSTSGATSYEIQISLQHDFSTLVNALPVIVSTNYYAIPAGLLNNFTTYYWRVRAINNYGAGNFSAPWSFRTAGTPPQEIISLEAVVENLGVIHSINPAQIQIMIQKLERAKDYYNSNRIFLANLNLQLFKLRVYILVLSENLSNTEGQSLIYNADKIIELINGDNPQSILVTPAEFELKQNYPNPFNPSTTIEYTVPEDSRVSLKIYDILGKEVATLVEKEQNAGTYIVMWDAKTASSGIYFYRITAGNYTDTKRMVFKK